MSPVTRYLLKASLLPLVSVVPCAVVLNIMLWGDPVGVWNGPYDLEWIGAVFLVCVVPVLLGVLASPVFVLIRLFIGVKWAWIVYSAGVMGLASWIGWIVVESGLDPNWGDIGPELPLMVLSEWISGMLLCIPLLILLERAYRRERLALALSKCCLNCGYDLRGIDSERCPECGHGIPRPAVEPS